MVIDEYSKSNALLKINKKGVIDLQCIKKKFFDKERELKKKLKLFSSKQILSQNINFFSHFYFLSQTISYSQ
jgi:hypothetical protein